LLSPSQPQLPRFRFLLAIFHIPLLSIIPGSHLCKSPPAYLFFTTTGQPERFPINKAPSVLRHHISVIIVARLILDLTSGTNSQSLDKHIRGATLLHPFSILHFGRISPSITVSFLALDFTSVQSLQPAQKVITTNKQVECHHVSSSPFLPSAVGARHGLNSPLSIYCFFFYRAA
jgi:hypothetical protein